MLKRWRTWPRWKRWAFLTLVFLVALGFVLASESVQECIDDYKHHYASDKPHGSLALLGFVLGATYRCLGRFVEANGEVLVALFTLALAIATGLLWWATRELALEGNRDSKRTLRHLERTAKIELRAYVSLREFAIRSVRFGGIAHQVRWDVAPTFENTGVTPAGSVELTVNHEFRDDDLPEDFTFPDLPTRDTPSLGTIGPRCHATSGAVEVPYATVVGILRSQKRAFIWGWLGYSDVFPKSPVRHTDFAGEIEAHGPENNPDAIELRVVMLNRHNEAT
jgi:hypothetical protein